ncbi:hypothetical protein AB0K60_03285 [Thermopolyspora sp. NPDC052614]|uniref:hypothetical protein n=1 Tax=Thermopolyspora sp. NPDC052614 TaxID=3155682 RepID=UPI0034300FBB
MHNRWLRGAVGAAVAAALLAPTVPAFAQGATQTEARTVGRVEAPATVANKLFNAWLRRDRVAAARVATPASVTSLFSYPFRAPDKFLGCSGNACRFVHTSVRVPGGLNGILMVVSDSKVVKVYRSRHITKPASAARYLYAAHVAGDRNRGLEVATTGAVKTLFRVKYDPWGVKRYFQGCQPEPKGFSCAYSYEGGAMFMHVRGSKAAGYYVHSIGYIAD